ncbi:hypothetical protein ATANTOWER_006266 [Ataeniobius toweri]|uniref:Secreted protein n=1 Tax=Ataeniobius toweri TaxID=208326 RepID=A0ABU7AY51_9TELE|nr:hypothetical protein [Ataeniobius toweri]
MPDMPSCSGPFATVFLLLLGELVEELCSSGGGFKPQYVPTMLECTKSTESLRQGNLVWERKKCSSLMLPKFLKSLKGNAVVDEVAFTQILCFEEMTNRSVTEWFN